MLYRSSLAAALLIAGLSVPVTSAVPTDATSLARLVENRPANEGRVGTMNFELKNLIRMKIATIIIQPIQIVDYIVK